MAQIITEINLEDLKLWTENPRDPFDAYLSDQEIIKHALEDKNDKWKLHTLSKQMGTFYDFSEIPIVVEVNGKYIVFDGNRRVAILKYLKDPSKYLGSKALKFNADTTELQSIKKLPCNLCDRNTALLSIERKHVNNGSWKPLERDWFQHLHLGEKKSAFIEFDEATNLISSNPKMNQRFVKEETLTKQNLNSIGFDYIPGKGYYSNYNEETTKIILDKVVDLVNSKILTTRNNRGDLLKPLEIRNPDISEKLKAYNSEDNHERISYSGSNKSKFNTQKKPVVKTRISKENKILFGKTLVLQPGPINDLYSAIKVIYEKHRDNIHVISIIGMSLRLLVETASRVYFKDDPTVSQDKVYDKFLKVAVQEMGPAGKKKKQNFLSLTENWLSGKTNLEAILGKYAHGNIIPTEKDVLTQSMIIGEILEFYFTKKTK